MLRLFVWTISAGAVLFLAGCSGNDPGKASETAPAGEPEARAKKFTHPEIGKHNTKEDCWTAFEGKVYDITAYLPKHPAGIDKASRACGNDISGTFLSNPRHAAQGKANLEPYLIGELEYFPD